MKYATGRNYGVDQVLEISNISTVDDSGVIYMFVAMFRDEARHIAGRVNGVAFGKSPDDIGAAVLAEYDAGRYQIVDGSFL